MGADCRFVQLVGSGSYRAGEQCLHELQNLSLEEIRCLLSSQVSRLRNGRAGASRFHAIPETDILQLVPATHVAAAAYESSPEGFCHTPVTVQGRPCFFM